MAQGKVLVVGGGIGGLTAAIALRQVDYAVELVELHPDVRSSVFGVGIIQPVNALRALESLGVLEECLEAGFASEVWGAMHDVDGNPLYTMPGGKIEGTSLPPMNGLTRPKLHEILTTKALAEGVRIRYSTTFTSLEPGTDGVVVAFTDGTRQTYDIVVGADGVNSKVRKYVLGEDVKPEYIGQSAFRLNVPRPPEVDKIYMQEGPHGRAGLVPIGKDLAYMFFNYPMDRADRPDPATLDQTLRDLLKPFGGVIGRVRDNHINDPDQIVVRPEDFLIAPAPWHKGRIVLIGDAVHTMTPHLGQGAAQAIEDVVVLAEELGQHRQDLETAFTNYVERRYDRCKLIVESSIAIADWQKYRVEGFDNATLVKHVLDVMVQPL